MNKPPSSSQDMIKRVRTRLQVASFGHRFYLVTLTVSAAYAAVLLFARFTGLPQGFDLNEITLLSIPVASLAIAAIWHHIPTDADAARAVDRTNGTKDLFLTYALLDNSAGDYQPLVTRDAEEQASRVDPEYVVAWNWLPRAGRVAAVIGGLLLAVTFLPQFDPFGKVAQAKEAKDKQVQLAKDRKATQLRTAELKEQGEQSPESKEVDRAIKDLTKTFGQVRRDQQEKNRDLLDRHQKELGEKWRKLGAEKLRTLLNSDSPFQDFGGERQQKLKKWADSLMDGSSDEINNELQQLANELADILSEMDPVKRSEMAKDLKERLRDLEEFASETVGSPELSAALRRAMRQLEQMEEGKSPQEIKETMKALAESLDLTKMELKQIAEAAKDMKKLEEALEALQRAKSLNEQNELDGEDTGEFQTLADYAEFYAEMMGDQEGEGTGGEGFGEGGEVPENEDEKTDFKKEKEKIATRAGKILMSIKGKGMSEAGEAKKEYTQAINEVKQGVSEAIRQEQIPPGYHDGIRGYFDSIDEQSNGEQQQ